MGITPMEINNKEFKRAFRGYDIDEVDDFLEQIVEDYEKLYKENAALREKLNSITEKLEHYTKIEATLQNTLVLAQGAADQAKSNSQKEAELVIKNANDTAQKIIDQAHTEVVRVTGEYERIKQEFQLFKSRYKSFIQTQLDLLSDIDTVTNESRNTSNIELSVKSIDNFNKSLDINSKQKDIVSTPFEDIVKISPVENKPNVYSERQKDFNTRTIDFKPKTIDFSAKTNEFSANFDDFDDDDNTY